MIGDRKINVERNGDRSQQTLGLTQRMVEHQTQRETGLDGQRRIDRLTITLSGVRRSPCRQRLLSDPHGQASPPRQSSIIFRPIGDPISRLRELVMAVLVEFVRRGFQDEHVATS